MKSFSDIKHRIKSVSDTRKITGAMEMISVAKMRKASARFERNQKYFETIRRTINEIVLYTHDASHKVFEECDDKNVAVIVISSDKGLAGGFNQNVLDYALAKLSDFERSHVFAVGQLTTEYFRNHGVEPDGEFADASYDPSISQAAEMSERIYSLFDGGKIDGAYVVYTAFDGHGKMHPECVRVLPFERAEMLAEHEFSAEEKRVMHDLVFEPSMHEVLEMLIPQYLTGMIYGALIQSSVCEHSCRHSAMQNATQNATEILDKLNTEYNRARQESVTGDIIEIVTASNGVTK